MDLISKIIKSLFDKRQQTNEPDNIITIKNALRLKNLSVQTKDLPVQERQKLLRVDQKICDQNTKVLDKYMQHIGYSADWAREYDMIELDYPYILEQLRNHRGVCGLATDLCDVIFDVRVLGVVIASMPEHIYGENGHNKLMMSTWLNFLFEYVIYMSKVYLETELGSYLDWDEEKSEFTYVKFEQGSQEQIICNEFMNVITELLGIIMEMFVTIDENENDELKDMSLNFDLNRLLTVGVFEEYN